MDLHRGSSAHPQPHRWPLYTQGFPPVSQRLQPVARAVEGWPVVTRETKGLGKQWEQCWELNRAVSDPVPRVWGEEEEEGGGRVGGVESLTRG